MPLREYGVLKGRSIDRRLGSGQNPLYQIHVIDETTDYRIAVNVASTLSPSDLEYFIDSRFQHPFLDQIGALWPGWHRVAPKLLNPDGLRVDEVTVTKAQASLPGFSIKS